MVERFHLSLLFLFLLLVDAIGKSPDFVVPSLKPAGFFKEMAKDPALRNAPPTPSFKPAMQTPGTFNKLAYPKSPQSTPTKPKMVTSGKNLFTNHISEILRICFYS